MTNDQILEAYRAWIGRDALTDEEKAFWHLVRDARIGDATLKNYDRALGFYGGWKAREGEEKE